MNPRYASVVFDADSTLARIEGIDWLGALRGPELGVEVHALTQRAMAGHIALEDVYPARLDAIRPTHAELEELSRVYVAAIEPGAVALCARLRSAGVHLAIVSGGLRVALLPMARELGIPDEHLHAVSLRFDGDGRYLGLDGVQPLTTQNGKPRVVQSMALPRPSVMIGDGSTDAAVRGVSDTFIAYTGVAHRPTVVAAADAEASDFEALARLLFDAT